MTTEILPPLMMTRTAAPPRPRMTITEGYRPGVASISYYSEDALYGEGGMVTLDCTASERGGYVHVLDGRGGSTQICERLAGSGSTLYLGAGRSMASLLRREYRRMRAAEAREAARY